MATGDLPEELADVLAGIQRLIRRRLRHGLPAPRLRGAQVELLRLVASRPGIRVSAAAQELYLAGNSVSTLVNQLSRAGYLCRQTDPLDRRSAQLFPTLAARSRLHDWEVRRSALVREQVTRLTEADRTALEAALPALRRLAHNLHQQTEGP
ncbi:MarR family winged helix-turn-helix transcriptional regulator [Streptomyces noursei]|uniref:MarR family winged helix-turn-helix transcriptional regulator n=1 Tax=Streptomyces noursei TaxID=1971 RepID=UPI0023B8078E|nr:MarR family winged helix-turn-helix transcriptional regulator [Streptomyces noursei]